MDFDDFLNPYRPLLDEVEVLNALYDAAEPERLIKQFTLVFRNLYEDDRDELYGDDQPLDQAGRVRRFLDRVNDLSSMMPTLEELDRAPTLHRWCGARLGSSPFLLGHVMGHPTLRWGARAHTSVLFQIAPDHSWARTWNRFYSLADYTHETLFRMQADGKVPPAVELIRLDRGPLQ
jgi:hypothetical protein